MGEDSVIPQACRVSIPMLQAHASLTFCMTARKDSVFYNALLREEASGLEAGGQVAGWEGGAKQAGRGGAGRFHAGNGMKEKGGYTFLAQQGLELSHSEFCTSITKTLL